MSQGKNLGGRPEIVLTDEQIAQVEALAAYLPIAKIADYLSISCTTFNEIKNRQTEVSVAYKRGVAKAHATAGMTLMKFMNYDSVAPNPSQLQMQLQATIFYLKTQARWSETQVLETHDKTPQKRFILEVEDDFTED
tara:strand:+ start:270 stop:680 length:411 start_codon:yes stop_codon:yes gene_type:complete